MFGSSLGQNKPAGGGLFGSTLGTNTQQSGSGLFGGLGQNNQQNQQQQTGGLFGSLGQNTQQNRPQQTGGLFGQSTQNQPQQSGVFGQSAQQNQQGGGLFGGLGQNTQQNQQQQSGGLFGGLGQQNQTQQTGGLFGGLNQNHQQQQQQQPGGLFGGSTQGAFGQSTQQQNQPQLGQSTNTTMWQPLSAFNAREKTVPEQIALLLEKWDTGNPNCVFKHYFYNKVEENMAPYYRPPLNEDPKAWEDALAKKPGPGFIPVLCVGFAQMGERIKLQQRNLANFNARLHEINNSLSSMMQNHETQTSVRAMDARRKHLVLKQRCLALATKVQVLRNRGYAMGGDEEVLRTKLLTLEKSVNDPGLGARGEEIWARMLIVQERARLLKSEIEKSGTETFDILDEEMSRRAKKILEDYNTQLLHLKTEVEAIQKDFVEWEKEQGPAASKTKETPRNDTQGRPQQFV